MSVRGIHGLGSCMGFHDVEGLCALSCSRFGGVSFFFVLWLSEEKSG
jgi:hypothetical protein